MTTKTRKSNRTLVAGTVDTHQFAVGATVQVWPSWKKATVTAHYSIRDNGVVADTLYFVAYADGRKDRVDASEVASVLSWW